MSDQDSPLTLSQSSFVPAQHFPTLGLLLILTLILSIIYLQAADGPFLLDDKANIVFNSGLEISELSPSSIAQAATSMSETFSGRNPWLNRPLAYVSFGLNNYFAEAPRWAMKATNIVLHGLIGLLVYTLVFYLARGFLADRGNPVENASPHWIALWSAAAWLCHPLMVSTVLYTVQRMTQLSMLFSLLALIVFVRARIRLMTTNARLWPSILLIALLTTLAFLSKENGVLVVLLCAVIEVCVFRGRFAVTCPNSKRRLVYASLALPLVLLVLYLGHYYFKLDEAILNYRLFSAPERTLTQIPILLDYLRWLILPTPADLGFLHDHARISHSLIDPPYTLISLLIWIAMAFACLLLWRRHQTVPAFALLWFLAAHVLESTVIPLELVFEHRNYLPYVGPIFALVYYSQFLWSRLSDKAFLQRCFPFVLFVVLPFSLSAERINHWRSDAALLKHWAQINAESPRFWAKLADASLQSRQYDNARLALKEGWKHYPQDAGFGLAQITLHCMQVAALNQHDLGKLVHQTNTALQLLPATAYERSQFENFIQQCPSTLEIIHPLYQTGTTSPARRIAAKSHYMLAHVALRSDQIAEAIAHFEAVLQHDANAHIAAKKLEQLRAHPSSEKAN